KLEVGYLRSSIFPPFIRSINKWHQPLRPPHVVGVGRSQRVSERFLFHIHAMDESRENWQKDDEQCGPVLQRKGKPDERQEHTGIRRMTKDAKRSALDQRMVLFDGYVHGEEAAQHDNRPPAHDYSEGKEHCPNQ